MNSENDWTVYRTRFLVHARQLTEPLAFTDALGREHSGGPGDYLVEYSEGCLRITARKIFEDVYVPLQAPPLSNSPDHISAPDLHAVTSRKSVGAYAYREVMADSVGASA